MAKSADIASGVLEGVGGAGNVSSVMHCMTRLRFNLKDKDKVDDKAVKAVDGVIGTQDKGGQYQVIIGPGVPEVYDEVVRQGAQAGGSVDEDLSHEDKKLEKPKPTLSAIGNKIVDYISGSVVPLIPVIITGALFKTLAAVLGPTMLNLVSADSEFMFLCNMLSNAAYYFMPILVGASAAKKMNMNSFLGAFMGAALIEPSFVELASTEGATFHVFGIPAPVQAYGSSLLPILLCIPVMSIIYKFIDRILPESIRTVFAPFITMVIMLPLGFCLLAPMGNYLGVGIAAVLSWLSATPLGWLATTIIAATWGLLVLTGMHLGLAAIALAQYAQTGSDTCILLGANIQAWTAAGVMLAICIRMKDKRKKAQFWSYFFTQFFGGVGEPMLFGVYIPYKRPFVAGIVGAAVSGFYAAVTHVVLYTPIQGFAVPLSYIGGSDPMNEVNGVIGMLLGTVVAFIVSWFYSLTPEEREGKDPTSASVATQAQA